MEDVAGMMSCSKRRSARTEDDEDGLRKGPWTVEEDLRLITCISSRGEGRWNAIAKAAGLRRTGKSCRLRWLNYLRPDLKRGNITPEEQLLILDLHCRFGNQWSKIARHLPGRTDNEIKNYWRTRIQKHIDRVGGNVEMLRYSWIQRFMLFHHASNNNNNNRRNLCCAASNASVIASSTGNDDDNQTLICETAPLNPEIVIQNEFQNQESASASSSAGAKEGSQSETENLNQMCCGSSDDKGNGWLSDWNTECGWDWDTHHNHSSNSSLLWNDQDCFFPL